VYRSWIFGGQGLSRVEIYKTKRHRRQKCIGAVILFVFILTVGILTVDQVTNNLVAGQQGFSIAAFENRGNYFEITFMNRTFYINMEYVNRDLEKLRRLFQG
jgi:hypothetical protein